MKEHYISMFKTSSDLFIPNGTAKTKLASCEEFVKSSNRTHSILFIHDALLA